VLNLSDRGYDTLFGVIAVVPSSSLSICSDRARYYLREWPQLQLQLVTIGITPQEGRHNDSKLFEKYLQGRM
jgi:hypothetical protein